MLGLEIDEGGSRNQCQRLSRSPYRAINLPAAEYEAAGLAEVAVAPAEAVIEALRLEAAAAAERPTKCA